MPPPPPRPCARHTSAAAGWRCVDCQRALCPDCTARERAGTAHFDVCLACGGRAEVLRVHRSHWPLAERLREAPRYLLHPGNLALVVGLAAWMALMGFLVRTVFPLAVLLPLTLSLGAFWGVFFAIVRSTARGEAEVETPEFTDIFSSFAAPMLRGLVATSALWVPAVAYLLLATRWTLGDMLGHHLTSPVLWAFLVLGAVWLPLALTLAACGGSLATPLNPLAALVAAQRLGRDLWVTVGAFLLGLVPLALASWVGDLVARLPVLVLAGWLAEALTLLVPLTLAHVVGLLLHVRGDAIGYGVEADSWVPVLPGVAPRGVRPRSGPLAAAAPGPEAPAAAPAEASHALAAAVEARDVPTALALYAQVRGTPALKGVAPGTHLFVGQAAASCADYALAVEALERAADVAPDAPSAPRALVLMARVLGERLGEPSRAQEVYRYVVHRYPDTDASRFAAGRLPPTG